MDEMNNSLSFLDLLEHMRRNLGAAGKLARDLDERLKELTGIGGQGSGDSGTDREDD